MRPAARQACSTESAVALGQAEVEHHRVVGLGLAEMLRVLAVRRVVEGEVLGAQRLGDLGGQRRVVLHEQESSWSRVRRREGEDGPARGLRRVALTGAEPPGSGPGSRRRPRTASTREGNRRTRDRTRHHDRHDRARTPRHRASTRDSAGPAVARPRRSRRALVAGAIAAPLAFGADRAVARPDRRRRR